VAIDSPALLLLKRTLINYKPKDFPKLKPGDPTYFMGEFQTIAKVIESLREVILDHEKRLDHIEDD
jgi:hypothetical protein